MWALATTLASASSILSASFAQLISCLYFMIWSQQFTGKCSKWGINTDLKNICNKKVPRRRSRARAPDPALVRDLRALTKNQYQSKALNLAQSQLSLRARVLAHPLRAKFSKTQSGIMMSVLAKEIVSLPTSLLKWNNKLIQQDSKGGNENKFQHWMR